MNEQDLLRKLETDAEAIEFDEVMSVIDENYDFKPGEFRNGDQSNAAGQNNGSLKLFAFAQLHKLAETQTLACFGKYYREDVLNHPNADSHQNIRNFIEHGWKEIDLPANTLTPKTQ